MITARLSALRPYPANTVPTPASPAGLGIYPHTSFSFGAKPGGLGCEVGHEMNPSIPPEGRYGMAVLSEQTLLGLEQDVRRWCQTVSVSVVGVKGNRG